MMNTVREQLARDYNCKESDFTSHSLKVTTQSAFCLKATPSDRLKIVSFYSSAVAMVDTQLKDWATEFFGKIKPEWIFEQSNQSVISEKIKEVDAQIDDIYLYFIPSLEPVSVDSPDFETKFFDIRDIEQFRGKEAYAEALPFNNINPDQFAIGAIKDGKIIGLAGASRNYERMWEMGVNVSEEYSGRHIGSKLIAKLKEKCLDHDIIPFYKTKISHIISQNVAINAGLKPAWSELTTKPTKSAISLKLLTNAERVKVNAIYANSFPERERLSFDTVCKKTNIYGIFRADELVGFMSTLDHNGYCVLDYFAIDKNYRDKGYGKMAMARLYEVKKDAKGIILDLETPGEASTESENIVRARRQSFYSRLGFLNTTAHFEHCGVHMTLMYLPINENPQNITPIYCDIYKQIYGVATFSERLKF